jgi:transposase
VNLGERFFNKIKRYQAIAKRYDKLGESFLPLSSWSRLLFCSTEDWP